MNLLNKCRHVIACIFAIYCLVLFASYNVSQTLLKTECIFNQDLTFIHKTILENHPGICNTLDPNFLDQMEKNYKIAEQKLAWADTSQEKIKILEEYGESFHDAHLWVKYDLEKSEAKPVSQKMGVFTIQKLENETYWIKIPSFKPSKYQIVDLTKIIDSLPLLREQNLVFDLRGNSGGNSAWGNQILKALFGEDYANQQLIKSTLSVYVEWRASEGNLNHVQNQISYVKEQFGENHPTTHWIKNTYAGMQQAYSMEECYYTEPSEVDSSIASQNHESMFGGNIVAIIDKNCGSACLNFIDGLKAMDTKVIFIGENTTADSVYMELRKVVLPSEQGTLGFPIKVYRNRPRGHNIPHVPDIQYHPLENTEELQKFVIDKLLS
jgi:hypothetical protein